MKKQLLSVAVSSVLLASANAYAAPEIYGQLNLSVSSATALCTPFENTTTENDVETVTTHCLPGTSLLNGSPESVDGYLLENNHSRIGFKGQEKLTNGIHLMYQLEYGVENMTSNASFKARNGFLGLKTFNGNFLIGRNDTVFKQAQAPFDVFADTNADNDRLFAAQERASNSFTYYSPLLLNMMHLNATYLINSDANGDNNYAFAMTMGDKNLSKGNYYSFLGYNKGIAGIDAYSAGIRTKMYDFEFGFLYQNSDGVLDTYYFDSPDATLPTNFSTEVSGASYELSAIYHYNRYKFKFAYGIDDSGVSRAAHLAAQYALTENPELALPEASVSYSGSSITRFTAGVDYQLARNTLIYGQLTQYAPSYETSETVVFEKPDGTASSKVVTTSHDIPSNTLMTIGINYNF